MQRSVLVPLDGSAESATVLPAAMGLARATRRVVIVLHIVAPQSTPRSAPLEVAPVWSPRHPDASPTSTPYDLTGIMRCITASAAGAQLEMIEAENAAAAIVARAARDPRVEVIAMTTHGTGGVFRWVPGRVVRSVLQAAPRPVLLVPARPNGPSSITPTEFRTIVVPLDGSSLAETALGPARALAAGTGGRLVLLSITQQGTPRRADPATGHGEGGQLTCYLEHVGRQLQLAGVRLCTLVSYGAPAGEILRCSDVERADLIVLAAAGQGMLRHRGLGHVTAEIVQCADVPVLLLGRPDERACGMQGVESWMAAGRSTG